MPSIAEAVQRNQSRIRAGSPLPTTPEQPLVEAPPTPPLDLPANVPQRGMFPATVSGDADRNDSARIFRGQGMRSSAFPYPQTPQITQKATIVQQSVAAAATSTAISLQTNGAPNPVQTVLNLIAGTGVTLVDDLSGGVTITSTSAGDGLAHGDSIWWTDTAWMHWWDDFKTGAVGASLGTSGSSLQGEMRWDGAAGTGMSLARFDGAWPHIGTIRISNGGTLNTSAGLFWPGAGGLGSGSSATGTQQGGFPLLDYPGWKMVWVFGFNGTRATGTTTNFPLTKKQLYIGFCTPRGSSSTFNVGGGVQTRPPYFIGLRYDTDTTSPAISDSTFHFECVANPNFGSARNNTQGNTFDTGISPTEYRFYRLEISCTTSGTISFYLTDGTTTASTTLTPLKVTSKGTIGGLNLTLSAGNGLGEVNEAAAATSTTSNLTMGLGSKVAITGAANSVFNTTVTIVGGGLTTQYMWISSGSVTETNSAATLTYYPTLAPFFMYGNTSEASPNIVEFAMDYFSLVWNSGLAASPLTLAQKNVRWVNIAEAN